MDARTAGRSTAAPHVVWSLLSAIETWPLWTPTVTSVTREATDDEDPRAPGSIGVGSRFSVTQPRLGRASWVVTQWEEGRSFTWVSRRPGIRTTATHHVHPRDGARASSLPSSGPAREPGWPVRCSDG
ncbi:hypothetical protein FNH13_11055 [Ornithinimicrobium ciconiae]|uniref:Polyketide cyclase n=1 Tax=Ornithinimicrobium ciconiae TaxID=2594265 RepID=A0A516GB81_9MICO|nr:hypothetical protein FNH13_11055 [Ornithinimicrobium ciconiae]